MWPLRPPQAGPLPPQRGKRPLHLAKQGEIHALPPRHRVLQSPRHVFVARDLKEPAMMRHRDARDTGDDTPAENVNIGSSNGRCRPERLKRNEFTTLTGGRETTAAWRDHCNVDRPHDGLGHPSPAEHAALAAGPEVERPRSISPWRRIWRNRRGRPMWRRREAGNGTAARPEYRAKEERIPVWDATEFGAGQFRPIPYDYSTGQRSGP